MEIFVFEINKYEVAKVVPDLGYWYIIWEVTTKYRSWIWKTPSAIYASGVGDFM